MSILTRRETHALLGDSSSPASRSPQSEVLNMDDGADGDDDVVAADVDDEDRCIEDGNNDDDDDEIPPTAFDRAIEEGVDDVDNGDEAGSLFTTVTVCVDDDEDKEVAESWLNDSATAPAVTPAVVVRVVVVVVVVVVLAAAEELAVAAAVVVIGAVAVVGAAARVAGMMVGDGDGNRCMTMRACFNKADEGSFNGHDKAMRTAGTVTGSHTTGITTEKPFAPYFFRKRV